MEDCCEQPPIYRMVQPMCVWLGNVRLLLNSLWSFHPDSSVLFLQFYNTIANRDPHDLDKTSARVDEYSTQMENKEHHTTSTSRASQRMLDDDQPRFFHNHSYESISSPVSVTSRRRTEWTSRDSVLFCPEKPARNKQSASFSVKSIILVIAGYLGTGFTSIRF